MFGQQSKSNLLGRATAEFMLQAAAIRLSLALKAGYRPQQPRLPRGNVDGGQWTLVPAMRGSSGFRADVQVAAKSRSEASGIRSRRRSKSCSPNRRPLCARRFAKRAGSIPIGGLRLRPIRRPTGKLQQIKPLHRPRGSAYSRRRAGRWVSVASPKNGSPRLQRTGD